MTQQQSATGAGTIAKCDSVAVSGPEKKTKGRDQLIAQVAIMPTFRGATAATAFAKGMFGNPEPDFLTYVDELIDQAQAVANGNLSGAEVMLATQANTLDLIFNKLVMKAASCDGIHLIQAFMQLALKAQSQCRTTVEALAEIKNPRTPTFVKQQNVAQQQQVNNGVPAPIAHAHGKEKSTTSNELLEAHDGERLDTGAAGAAGGVNSNMEAVAVVKRSEDSGGQVE